MDSFDLVLDDERHLVKITAAGEIYQEDGEKLITVARTTAAQHGYDLLYDIRKATAKIPFVSYFNLPRELQVYKDIKTRRVKAAVLISEKDKALKDYKFYETVTDNVGIKLRFFFDETEALEWLAGASSK